MSGGNIAELSSNTLSEWKRLPVRTPNKILTTINEHISDEKHHQLQWEAPQLMETHMQRELVNECGLNVRTTRRYSLIQRAHEQERWGR